MKRLPSPSMAGKAAVLLALSATLAAAFPNVYGALKTPLGASFLWSGYPWDTNQYFAFMRTGYRGDWLMTNLLTSEPHPPVLLMPFFVALGHVAAWYRDFLTWREGQVPLVTRTIPFVYNGARIALTFLLFLAVYGLAALVTTRRARRLWIVAFAAFAGGVRWGPEVDVFTDSHVLKSCVLFPNFVVSLIFYVCVCAAFVQTLKRDLASRKDGLPRAAPRLWPAILLAALGGLGIGFVHPFDAPSLAAIGFAALACGWAIDRNFPASLCLAVCTFSCFAGAPILYQAFITWRIPEFGIIHSQNAMRYEHWWSGLAQLEVYLLVAALGLPFLFKRRRRPESLFVLCWVTVGVLMIHVPLQFQRRMIEGLPIALAFALPTAIESAIVRPLLRGGKRKTANPKGRIRLVRHAAYAVVFVLLLPKTLWVLYDRSVGVFGRPNDQYYVRMAEVEALDWLSRHSDWRQPVWAVYRRDNRIPFLSGNRAFLAHGVMTVHAGMKKQWTEDLFAFRLPVQEFRRIVRRFGIEYIYWTEGDRVLDPVGRDFAEYDPETLGAPIYDNGYAKIFRVRSTSCGAGIISEHGSFRACQYSDLGRPAAFNEGRFLDAPSEDLPPGPRTGLDAGVATTWEPHGGPSSGGLLSFQESSVRESVTLPPGASGSSARTPLHFSEVVRPFWSTYCMGNLSGVFSCPKGRVVSCHPEI